MRGRRDGWIEPALYPRTFDSKSLCGFAHFQDRSLTLLPYVSFLAFARLYCAGLF